MDKVELQWEIPYIIFKICESKLMKNFLRLIYLNKEIYKISLKRLALQFKKSSITDIFHKIIDINRINFFYNLHDF